MNAREVARRTLSRVERDGEFASSALSAEMIRAGLDARDRGLATELVYGVLRHRTRLDRALLAVTEKGGLHVSPVARSVLRVAAYQLLFLDRVPAHAAVTTLSPRPARSTATSSADLPTGCFASSRTWASRPCRIRRLPRWTTRDRLFAAALDRQALAAQAGGRDCARVCGASAAGDSGEHAARDSRRSLGGLARRNRSSARGSRGAVRYWIGRPVVVAVVSGGPLDGPGCRVSARGSPGRTQAR